MDGLELLDLLLPFPKRWDYTYVPACLSFRPFLRIFLRILLRRPGTHYVDWVGLQLT